MVLTLIVLSLRSAHSRDVYSPRLAVVMDHDPNAYSQNGSSLNKF
jgi:hypothetical protein